MKKIFSITLITIGLFFNQSFAQQELPDFENIKLDQKSDYKQADSAALKASTYLLSTPFEKDNIHRLHALSFVIKWMSGTPDFSFTLDEDAIKTVKGNEALIGLYMAAMTKYALENRSLSKDTKAIKLNSLILLLNYCENTNNNIKMTKQLKKLSEAKAKGQLI